MLLLGVMGLDRVLATSYCLASNIAQSAVSAASTVRCWRARYVSGHATGVGMAPIALKNSTIATACCVRSLRPLKSSTLRSGFEP